MPEGLKNLLQKFLNGENFFWFTKNLFKKKVSIDQPTHLTKILQ